MDFDKYVVKYDVKTREDREEYRQRVRDMEQKFRLDLEEEFGVPHDASYAEKLFSMAW